MQEPWTSIIRHKSDGNVITIDASTDSVSPNGRGVVIYTAPSASDNGEAMLPGKEY
jgi:hypothetical protein